MEAMQPRVDIITLGVADLAAAHDFYVGGLGWAPALYVPGEVLFLQVGHGLLLGLWDAEAMTADNGRGALALGPSPINLSHNVASEAEVRSVLAAAETAGGTVVKAAQPASFGGYHGLFADPAGFCWEVATNLGWSVAPDGRVTIG